MIDLSGGGGDGDGIVVFGVSEAEVFWLALYIFENLKSSLCLVFRQILAY
jgi:hypothetical protein